MRARIEEDRDSLYRDYWQHFESPYWGTEVTVARKKVMLSELFLQHFLIAKLGNENVTAPILCIPEEPSKRPEY